MRRRWLKCDACDVALTHHKGQEPGHLPRLRLGAQAPRVLHRAAGLSILHYGGVGTERLEREVKSAFPDAVVRRMDSDTMKLARTAMSRC